MARLPYGPNKTTGTCIECGAPVTGRRQRCDTHWEAHRRDRWKANTRTYRTRTGGVPSIPAVIAELDAADESIGASRALIEEDIEPAVSDLDPPPALEQALILLSDNLADAQGRLHDALRRLVADP